MCADESPIFKLQFKGKKISFSEQKDQLTSLEMKDLNQTLSTIHVSESIKEFEYQGHLELQDKNHKESREESPRDTNSSLRRESMLSNDNSNEGGFNSFHLALKKADLDIQQPATQANQSIGITSVAAIFIQNNSCHQSATSNPLNLESLSVKCRKINSDMQVECSINKDHRFDQKPCKTELYDRMEERIMEFLAEEKVDVQHVDNFLFEKNSIAVRRMRQQSQIKLDLGLSPLRRHRANTFCI